MQSLLFEDLFIKRIKKYFLTFTIVCVAFISFVYTPIYLLLSSNVLWRSSVVLFVWTELVGPLMDFSFYWGSFAFFIYIYLRFGKKQMKDFIVICSIAIAARYLVTMIVNFALMSFPGWDVLFGEELPSMLFSTAMDALQMVGVLWLTEYCCCRSTTNVKAPRIGAEAKEKIADFFLPERLFDFKKPLQKLCFFSALIPSGLKFLSRLYYDIFFWGMPADLSEWLLIFTYYIGDIASFFIGYFVLLYLLQAFYTIETKRRIDFES